MAQEAICKECQTPFTISDKDIAFYATMKDEKTGKPFSLPKRCLTCRKKKRMGGDKSPFTPPHSHNDFGE